MKLLRPTSLAHALLLMILAASGLAAAVGCSGGPDASLSPPAPGPDAAVEAGPSSRADDGLGAAPGAAVTDGVPCDVAALLASSCLRCHGMRPSHGAPMSLVTYEDLVAPWDEDPTRTIAEVSLERMRSVQSPMPPDGALPAASAAVLDAWVSAGTPRVSCAASKNGDADAAADPALVPDPDPFGTDPGAVVTDGGAPLDGSVCTSGALWSPSSPASASMAPGRRCLACHYTSGGPTLTLAGTVYPTLHEPDDCAGASTNVSVVIVDAAGKSHTLPVNSAGNFLRVTALPMPYTARVVSGGPTTRVREMVTPQTDGDCNGCHTEAGGRAPGRIMAP